jgi:hypothetical protein
MKRLEASRRNRGLGPTETNAAVTAPDRLGTAIETDLHT